MDHVSCITVSSSRPCWMVGFTVTVTAGERRLQKVMGNLYTQAALHSPTQLKKNLEKSRMVNKIKSFHTRKISVTDMSSVSGGPTQVEKKHVSSWDLTMLQTNELITAPCFYKSHKWKSWHKHMTSLQICAVKSLVTQWFIVNISRIRRAANSSLGRWDSLSPSQAAGWWPWTPSRSLSHSTQGFC